MSRFDARQFVESFYGGDAAAAIADIAETHDIAVAMQVREDFDAALGRDLTDEEWEDLAPLLESYGEFLGNSGAAESIAEWRYQMLDKAGITGDDED